MHLCAHVGGVPTTSVFSRGFLKSTLSNFVEVFFTLSGDNHFFLIRSNMWNYVNEFLVTESCLLSPYISPLVKLLFS